MEQGNFVKEILNALKLHGEHMDRKFDQIDQRFEQIDQRFGDMEKRFESLETRFDRVEKKMDGFRVELTETQENTNFLLSKNAQHEKRLRLLSDLHQ